MVPMPLIIYKDIIQVIIITLVRYCLISCESLSSNVSPSIAIIEMIRNNDAAVTVYSIVNRYHLTDTLINNYT